MVVAIFLLTGLFLGSFGVWFLQRAELRTLRKDKQTAEDRLFYAFRDDKVIPAPRTLEPVPITPLSKELQGEIDQWESTEGRAIMEAKIRSLQERGLGVSAILRELEEPKF